MGHNVIIDGTSHALRGGCIINGTSYKITSGNSLVNGTLHKIEFGAPLRWKIKNEPNMSVNFEENIMFNTMYQWYKLRGYKFAIQNNNALQYYGEREDGIGRQWWLAYAVGKYWNSGMDDVTFDVSPTGRLLEWLQANATPIE